MKTYCFEMKKLYKNKSLLIIFILACILSVANIIKTQTENSTSPFNSSDYDQYVLIFTDLLHGTNQDLAERLEGNMEATPGQMHIWSMAADPEAEVEELYGGRTLDIKNKDLQFKYYREALEMDQIALTPEDTAALNYVETIAHYEKEKKESEPSYKKEGAITDLLKDGSLLFGIIPLIVIGILATRLLGEDYEGGSLVFQRTLPVRRESVLLQRFIASFTMLVVYLLSVFFWNCLLRIMQGGGLGDWLFPYRVLDLTQNYLPAYQILGMYSLLFLVKGVLLLSLTFLLVTFMKQVNASYILLTLLFGLPSVLTLYFKNLQTIWNPFYTKLQMQVMGSMELVRLDRLSAKVSLTGTPMEGKVLLLWLFIGIWGVSIAMFIFKRNNKAQTTKEDKSKRSINGTFSLEQAKLAAFFSNAFLSGILLLVIGSLMTIILLEDRKVAQLPLTSDIFEEDYVENIAMYEEIISEYDVLAEQEATDSEKVQLIRLSQSLYEEMLEYYRSVYDPLLRRKAAYEAGDQGTYYETFDQELLIYYNPNDQYIMLDDGLYYTPRENYYETGAFPSLYGYEVSRSRIEEMKKRNIRPILGAAITYTEYDRPKQIADRWSDRLQYQLRDRSSLGLWYRLIYHYRLDLFLLFVILLSCGAAYSLEGRKRSSLGFLYTLPLERSKLLHEKLGAAFIRLGGILMCSILAVLLFGLLLDGFGDMSTPMLYYDRVIALKHIAQELVGSFHWASLGGLVLHSVIYLTLSGLFVTLLSFVMSTYFSQALLVSGGTLFILALGYGLNQLSLAGFQAYLPFNYLNLAPLLDGSYHFQDHLSRMHIHLGYGVLLVWISISYVFLQYRVKKMQLFK